MPTANTSLLTPDFSYNSTMIRRGRLTTHLFFFDYAGALRLFLATLVRDYAYTFVCRKETASERQRTIFFALREALLIRQSNHL